MYIFATFQTFLSVFCDPSQTSNLGWTFCDYCFRRKVQGSAAIDVFFFIFPRKKSPQMNALHTVRQWFRCRLFLTWSG